MNELHSMSGNRENQFAAARTQLLGQRAGDIRLALRQIQAWLVEDPENQKIYKILSDVAVERPERISDIKTLLEVMQQKGSQTAALVLEDLPATNEDLLKKADEAYYLGNYEVATRYYRQVLKQEPNNQRAQEYLAKIALERFPTRPSVEIPPEAISWYRQARSYMAAKDYETTITFLHAAIDAASEKNVNFQLAKDLLKATQKLGYPDLLQQEDLPNPLQTTNDISILFVSADPKVTTRLRTGEEVREIQEQLKLASLRYRFKLDIRLSARARDISQALLNFKPQIVHFSGHVESEGLCFETQSGEPQLATSDALEALFEQFSNDINCVILNACYSEHQAQAISRHVEWVIGIKQEIGDEAAIAFSIGFYQALGAGKTIEDAYKLGWVQIRLQGIPEHLTPVLLKKE